MSIIDKHHETKTRHPKQTLAGTNKRSAKSQKTARGQQKDSKTEQNKKVKQSSWEAQRLQAPGETF